MVSGARSGALPLPDSTQYFVILHYRLRAPLTLTGRLARLLPPMLAAAGSAIQQCCSNAQPVPSTDRPTDRSVHSAQLRASQDSTSSHAVEVAGSLGGIGPCLAGDHTPYTTPGQPLRRKAGCVADLVTNPNVVPTPQRTPCSTRAHAHMG